MEHTGNCLTKAAQQVTALAQRFTNFFSDLLVDQSKNTEEVLNAGNQVEYPRSLLPNEAFVINVNQSDVDVSDATSLVHQTPIGAQETHSFGVENPISLSSIEQLASNENATVRDQHGGDMSPNDPIVAQTPIAAQKTHTFHMQDPRNLPREVVSNGNSEVRHETRVEMPDSTSLLPQTPNAAQAAINSHMHTPRNLPQGGGQNSPGVANFVAGVPSQPPGPPTIPNAGHAIDFQALITEAKEVANRVTFISAGGIFSELSGVIGNEKATLMNDYFFKAFMILCYVSLALGIGLHRLIKINPNTRGFEMMVRITIYTAQGSLVYALSFAICVLFPSKVGVTFVLVVPLIPIGLVAILSFAPREHGSTP